MHICDIKNPCLNSGKCTRVVHHLNNTSGEEYDDSNDYRCLCDTDHTGHNCEKG